MTTADTPLILDCDRAILTLPCEFCGEEVIVDVLEFELEDATICPTCNEEVEKLKW